MTDFPQHPPRLVGDIGGTYARFALVDATGGKPFAERVVACADFSGPDAAMERYLADSQAPRPREAALAAATPITGDQIKLTNNTWSFSIEQTRERLALDRLLVLNDFTALALALPVLEAADLHQVGDGSPIPKAPLALIGPGTGLGISGLIAAGDRWIALSGEGGHATFSPANEREIEILRLVGERHTHVSSERLISGIGLPELHRAIAKLHGVKTVSLTPAEIVEQAKAGSNALCVEVLETFCAMLGTAAGNLALTIGARGGVYIGGGIVPKLGHYFDSSPFRRAFEHKGRFSHYLAAIPTYVIRTQNPALLGVARAFD